MTVHQGDVEPSGYKEDVVLPFTCGDCGNLALAITELVDGELVMLRDIEAEDPTDWWHAAVRVYDGYILDIEGLWTEAAWVARWERHASGYWGNCKMEVVAADDVLVWDDYLYGGMNFNKNPRVYAKSLVRKHLREPR